MRLGIDASNIGSGGGKTHLVELLRNFPETRGPWEEVHVWTSSAFHSELLAQLLPNERICLHICPAESLVARQRWVHRILPTALGQARCALLFAPGGLLPMRPGLPTVIAVQNQLSFSARERARFPVFTAFRAKLEVLGFLQRNSLKRSDGVIFLSEASRRDVRATVNLGAVPEVLIPLGIGESFFLERSPDLPAKGPIELLYVSTVFPYKHHEPVVRAIDAWNREPGRTKIRLTLVGSGPDVWTKPLTELCRSLDPQGEQFVLRGNVTFREMPDVYRGADLFIYASSCETFGSTLLEAMAAGLPILSSNLGPMPEMLGESGIYFNPEDSGAIVGALKQAVSLRDSWPALGKGFRRKAAEYVWAETAEATFRFLAEVRANSAKKNP